ncbi:PorT family protein [Parapedobacter sp. ISTM3]|uniref:porin family protein n=1 Tax=Parapedobacter sp. ISTM3 TaxID=2800130 RepID=UPI001905906C|nr:porin family protein [Parapedobacter sp. ISTM3]MBK1439829.1 PorT family protein [Parapedobacter sp. ISTM3]
MNNKELFFLLALMGITTACFAQLRWEMKAGLSYSKVTGKDPDGNKANTYSVPGIYLGLGAALYLSDQFAIRPIFQYARRGFKQPEVSYLGWGSDFEARVSYIELPVDLLYSPRIGPGKLLVAAGPYVGYGTEGTWTTSGPVLLGDIMIDGKGDIAFQNDNSYAADMNTHVYAKPWDYGAHLQLGYAFFSQYALTFDMQLGIADLQPKWADFNPESTVKNRSFAVSLVYRFL